MPLGVELQQGYLHRVPCLELQQQVVECVSGGVGVNPASELHKQAIEEGQIRAGVETLRQVLPQQGPELGGASRRSRGMLTTGPPAARAR